MIKVFLDTNILIDYLSHREPFFEPAALLLQLGQRKKCQLSVASMSFATASFILQAHYKMTPQAVRELFSTIIRICNITTIDTRTVSEAIASDLEDFEDAMQYSSARYASSDIIITRNTKDFLHSSIPVFTPTEFLVHYST